MAMREYSRTAKAALRAVDMNHLFLGDKLNANIDPADLERMVGVAKDHVDVVLYQFYGMGAYQKGVQERIAKVSGLPMINGDGGFGAYGDPRMPQPMHPQAKDQAERARWFLRYAKDAYSHPSFVGWHVCGVIDSWEKSPHGVQKAGIVNPLGTPHQEVIDAMATISEGLYEYREK